MYQETHLAFFSSIVGSSIGVSCGAGVESSLTLSGGRVVGRKGSIESWREPRRSSWRRSWRRSRRESRRGSREESRKEPREESRKGLRRGSRRRLIAMARAMARTRTSTSSWIEIGARWAKLVTSKHADENADSDRGQDTNKAKRGDEDEDKGGDDKDKEVDESDEVMGHRQVHGHAPEESLGMGSGHFHTTLTYRLYAGSWRAISSYVATGRVSIDDL